MFTILADLSARLNSEMPPSGQYSHTVNRVALVQEFEESFVVQIKGQRLVLEVARMPYVRVCGALVRPNIERRSAQ